MRKIVLVLLASFFVHSMSAQKTNGFGVYYGLNVSQFHTGSGHGSSFVINSNVQKGRKSLEMGMVYQDAEDRISGGDVKYKIYLGKNAFMESQNAQTGVKCKPYLHYNCIYHSTKVNTSDLAFSGSKKSTYPELPTTPGTIATMEHYSGFGLQVFLSKNICIDASAGVGAYIGSIDKYNAPKTLGVHKENHGFVLALEFGLGYKFGV